MGRLTRQRLGLAAIGVSWMVGGIVRAQNAPAAQPATNANTAASRAVAPVSINNAAPAPTIAAQLQRSGGSLARVQLAGQSDPATSGATSASYFAVAAPLPKLVHKHDLVVIVVNEQSNFSSTGLTDLKHTSDLNAEIDSYLALRLSNLRLANLTPALPLDLKASSAHDFNGQATLTRADALTTQISAEVIDVKPNGSVVLKASTHIKNDEEEQTIELTGICRVEDITADNSVLSTQLSNLDVKKTHTGAVRDTTERGFIPRLLDTINPF